MKTRTMMITLLLALVAMTGQAQIVCHVEGELMTDEYGDEFIICEEGTDLRVNDNPSLHVKAVNGKFSKTIECDHITKYEVYPADDKYRSVSFYAENGTVRIKFHAEQIPIVESDGEEWLKKKTFDRLLQNHLNEQFGDYNAITDFFYSRENRSELFTADFQNSMVILNQELANEYKKGNKGDQARIDSLTRVIVQRYESPDRFTPQGLELFNKVEAIDDAWEDFKCQYYDDHPLLESLYETLDAFTKLRFSDGDINFKPQRYERIIALYHDKLHNYFPGHPLHEQIALAEAGYNLQPGKPYIDYNVRNTDGQLVPISSLMKGKVALIDLWASWCLPCRRHSVAMIPVYEKYKDQGFTVIAIARQDSREEMEKAMKQDGYPWPSLLELKDENQVWRKNGADNAGGLMILVDRDGTILSTSTDAKELEPIIKKALDIK